MKRTNEISKIVGISKRTLQFYDDEGIIKVKRSKHNHRLYDKKVLENLWEIMVYKEMGIGLKEIKQLLEMSEGEKKNYLKVYIKEIEEKIQELKERKEYVSLIMERGLPQIPEENSGVTYKSRIAELRKVSIDE